MHTNKKGARVPRDAMLLVLLPLIMMPNSFHTVGHADWRAHASSDGPGRSGRERNIAYTHGVHARAHDVLTFMLSSVHARLNMHSHTHTYISMLIRLACMCVQMIYVSY